MSAFEMIRGGDLNLIRFLVREVSVSASEAMEADLMRRIEEDAVTTIVDLSSVERLSMRAVCLLARAARSLHRRGARLLLCGAAEEVVWALVMSRLNKLLTTFDSLEEALASVGRSGYRCLGQILVARGWVDAGTLSRALAEQRERGAPRKLGRLLVDDGSLSVEQLVDALWEQFHVLIGPTQADATTPKAA